MDKGRAPTLLAEVLQRYGADACVVSTVGEAPLLEVLKRGSLTGLVADPDIISTYVRTGNRMHVSSSVLEVGPTLDNFGIDVFGGSAWNFETHSPIWSRRAEYGIKGAWNNWRHDTMNASETAELKEVISRATRHTVYTPTTYAGTAGWGEFMRLGNGFTTPEVQLVHRAFELHRGPAVGAADLRSSPEYAPLQKVLLSHKMAAPANV
ncbi:MAG: hypothetical protein H7338_17125 [Candidatus Sericytochromatia bacterium]|nr:hypothetical protein [Candidatus Sericytochromatia bacterium]